ncbi:MAG: hypothetical protein JZU58_09325 [Curvibacter lanceolatus]|nr:hypothetical protein [Curvibacter lanceolatus]
MSKSKIIILAFVPFLLFKPAFSAEVRDAKTDNRRMSKLTMVNKNQTTAKTNSGSKSNPVGQTKPSTASVRK